MDKIQFYLPDFYNKFALNELIINMINEYPECFYDNIEIGAVYGCFPGSLWNGGRVCPGYTRKNQILCILKEYNDRGIPCRFTFTNSLLEERHLYDTFCNMCLEIADNGLNEVLVNSPLLEEYIRKNYPNYKIILSTTREIKTVEEIEKEAEKDYYVVVLDKSFNNTDKLLQLSNRGKYEILVDSFCMDSCPNSTNHYREVSRAQLNFESADFPMCSAINRDFYEFFRNETFITVEDIYGKYSEMGYNKFKLDGRAFNVYTVIESYMYYLVKPIHRDRVRLSLIKALDRLEGN